MTATLQAGAQQDAVQLALADRLQTALRLLQPSAEVTDDVVSTLEQLLSAPTVDNQTAWLALVATSTVLPLPIQVIELRRELEFAGPDQRAEIVLRVGLALMAERGTPLAHLEVVSDEWLVDVDYCARQESNTGIQRVARNVVPEWQAAALPLRLACWSARDGGYRGLSPLESARVLKWNDRPSWPRATPAPQNVLIPWNTTIVVAEVPPEWHCDVLTALVRFTPNRAVAIGYDCIPVVSAELLPEREANKFVHYLSLVKHLDVVAAISAAAAREFEGFVAALPTQGLTGPVVLDAGMAVEVPPAALAIPAEPVLPPQIICVGSHEPRKNHMAVLFAAETLWREGLDFSLRFIGGKSWDDQGFGDWVRTLRRKGRKVTADHAVKDADLWTAFRQSWFTVFASLHEGFGLPVGESLALGVPVITSDREPMSEIAVGGGALLVDPSDDDQLVAAMRTLLTDPDRRAALVAEAKARTFLTWRQYADRLWTAFSPGERSARDDATSSERPAR